MSTHTSRFVPSAWRDLARIGLLLLACATLGCAGADRTPSASSVASDELETGLPGPLASGPISAQGPLGVWKLEADFEAGTGQIVPVATRSAAAFTSGDSVVPDLTHLFTDENGLCGDCIKVVALGVDPTTLLPWLDIRVTHPLATGRPELGVFDLQLLLISDLPSQPILTFPGLGKTVHPRYVSNADGYTDQLTASLEAALGVNLAVDLFPFVNVGTDDSTGNFAGTNTNGFADFTNPSGHNVFAPGDSTVTRLALDTSVHNQVSIYLALSGSFFRAYTTKGNNLFQKNNPVYFLPEANRKEAWQVSADVLGSGLRAGDSSSACMLSLSIRDWQNGLAAQPSGWNPLEPSAATQSRAAIPATSDVASIGVEIPGILTIPIEIASSPHTGDGRTSASPLVYDHIELLNVAGGPAGTYPGLIRVRDSRVPEAAVAGEGEVLFQDGATFSSFPAFDTYALFEVAVADDYLFAGHDFGNTGSRIARTGASITADVNFFAGVGGGVSNSLITGSRVVVISAGAGFSGAGHVQVYHLATGALLVDYPFAGTPNPFDVALSTAVNEVLVTGFLSDAVYRINIDPAFTGDRLIGTIDLSPFADPTYFARPQEIIKTSTGRYFVAGGHFNASFTPAPAGLLFEINPALNSVISAVSTTGLRNCWSLVEGPIGSRVEVFGPGSYSGDGGSGSYNLVSNTWTVDPYPPGLAWTEAAATSTGRAFLSDAFLPTVAHIGLPFTGTINHQLNVLPPPVPPFPFISALRVDRGNYLYVAEFGDGILRVMDASAASVSTPPTVIDTLILPGGLDALGTFE